MQYKLKHLPVMRFVLFVLLMMSLRSHANDSTKLYNPYANVDKDMQVVLAKAKAEHKNVMIQIGGNWCVSCYRFNSFLLLDFTLKQLLNDNYVVYHLNYSDENKNLNYLKKLGNPHRYGFPVLVVMDSKGNRLYTEPCGLLGKGNGYDTDKVKQFLIKWSTSSLEASYYQQ